jgi:hypothetical protein
MSSEAPALAAIEATLYRYSWGIDVGDAELVGSCFAQSAELVSPGGTTAGRDAIAADVDAKREQRAARGTVRHLVTNIAVAPGAGPEKSVRSLFVATVNRDGATSIFATGWYEDTFVEEGGDWVIARRVMHMDGS